jgi:hypothetical protein
VGHRDARVGASVRLKRRQVQGEDVLVRAGALRAEGRVTDAIDLLTEANRTAARADVEL